MRVLTSSLALAALCATPIPAQTQTFLVAPKHGIAGGNSNNLYPLGAAPMRYQQVYDADSFDKVNPVAIGTLYQRMNSGFANGNYGGHTVELAMWMSFTATGIDSQTATTAYGSNQDAASLKQVIKKAKFLMPKLANTNFDIKLPFDSGVTFLYGAVLKRNLIVETRVYGNSNNNSQVTYPMDAVSGAAGSPTGIVVQNGIFAGCKASDTAGSVVQHNSVAGRLVVGDQTNYHFGNGYVPTIPAVMSLGASPLSITLPGTSCDLVNDLLLLAPGVTDNSSAGLFTVPMPIPNDSKLANVSYLTQMFFLDKKANQLGVTATRGLKNTIGAATVGNVTRIYGFGAPDSLTTASSIGKNYGLISQFSN